MQGPLSIRKIRIGRSSLRVGGNLLLAVGILGVLYLVSQYSYLLFHTLVEMFIAIIAGCIFVLGWNSRRFVNNDFLLVLAVAFLSICIIGVLHTLAYKGMDIFYNFNANLPTQLWVASRYLLSLSFLAAPAFLHRRVRPELIVGVYTVVVAAILLSIFSWRIFPDAYIEGVGLTPFKIISEYIVILIFAASLYLLHRNRKALDARFFYLFTLSILAGIASEFAFTQYVGVYEISNLIGHYLQLIAFYFSYKAIIETGFVRPYNLLFRDLVAANDKLEERVRERTQELLGANQELINEIQERQSIQAELSEVKSRLIDNSEAERLALAQELHDGPMQDLYGLAYRLEMLRDDLPEEEKATLLGSVKVTLEEVIGALRVTASELRPPALDSFGLEKAIRSHIEKFSRSQPELEIHLDVEKDGQTLPERTRLALYRIYQVALTNVIRHARASRVDIRLHLSNHSVVLEVQDNGCGFALPERWVELARSDHLGLVGALERAEAAGGTLEVESGPGEGTLLRVTLPRDGQGQKIIAWEE